MQHINFKQYIKYIKGCGHTENHVTFTQDCGHSEKSE